MVSKKDVVIVGGGAAGYPLARSLRRGKGFEVTLVDASPYFEFNPVLYRILEGAGRKAIGFPFDRRLGWSGISFHNAAVTQILPEEDRIETSAGELSYDYLVLAIGGEVRTFGFSSEQIHYLTDFESARMIRREALAGESVIIMGAGATGTETAFTLRHVNPDLDITVIDAGDRPVPQLREENSATVRRQMERRDIELRTGERVESVDGGTVRTTEGSYTGDFIVQATGVRPHSLVREAFDQEGLVVDEHLRSVEYDNIFGAGDCISLEKGQKIRRAYHATKEARVAAVNLLREAEGKDSLKSYTSTDAPIILTFGGWRGLYEGPYLSFTGVLPHLMYLFGVEKRFLWKYRYFT